MMKYTIEYREMENYLSLIVEGDQHDIHMKHAFRLAVAIARDVNCQRFLLDMTGSVVRDSIADTYHFSATIEDMGLLRSDRLAGIFNNQTKQHRFSETAAQNEGWNLRFFEDREKALRWLKEDNL